MVWRGGLSPSPCWHLQRDPALPLSFPCRLDLVGPKPPQCQPRSLRRFRHCFHMKLQGFGDAGFLKFRDNLGAHKAPDDKG